MIRCLVTRALPEALDTVADIEALGGIALVSPVRKAEALAVTWPAKRPDGLAATSANALRALPALSSDWQDVPVFAVGARTASAARAMGFTMVIEGGGEQSGLAKAVQRHLQPPASVLYLAGEPRRPEFEQALRSAGYDVALILCYRMVPVAGLDPGIVSALRRNAPDIVLHFSAETARTLAALAREGGVFREVFSGPQACLSAAIAEEIRSLAAPHGLAPPLIIAPEATSRALVQTALQAVQNAKPSQIN